MDGTRFDRFLALLDEVPVPADAEALWDPSSPGGALRRRNLVRYLELVHAGGADRLLVGEAPGWRGVSVTGVPFVSLRELEERPGPLTGSPHGDGFEVPRDPRAEWEASSRDVWRALADRRGPLPATWPVYPHHPFIPGRADSNRSPRPSEVRSGVGLVFALQDAFEGIPLIAVGRQAQRALARVGLDVPAVRHPARGGGSIFREQLLALGV